MSTVHTGCRHMPGPLFTGETAVASAETDGACLPCRTAPNLFSLLRFLDIHYLDGNAMHSECVSEPSEHQ